MAWPRLGRVDVVGVFRYRSAVLSALEETENALVNYSNEQSRRERLENAVHANEEAVTLSNDRYRAGLTDFLSVLVAERELYANEDLLAQSRTAQTLDLIALYKVLGGTWQPFSQPCPKFGDYTIFGKPAKTLCAVPLLTLPRPLRNRPTARGEDTSCLPFAARMGRQQSIQRASGYPHNEWSREQAQ